VFQRHAADQILRELQNHPDMWLQVVHILQNSQNLNTKFFALQVSFVLKIVFICVSINIKYLEAEQRLSNQSFMAIAPLWDRPTILVDGHYANWSCTFEF
jgi:hypothetical protein